jgi:hypothetical protein
VCFDNILVETERTHALQITCDWQCCSYCTFEVTRVVLVCSSLYNVYYIFLSYIPTVIIYNISILKTQTLCLEISTGKQ